MKRRLIAVIAAGVLLLTGIVPAAAASGVQIGAWRTFVKSVQIDTIGLGGDSIVTRNKQGELSIGPRRAMPLSYAATRWPKLRTELEALALKAKFSQHRLTPQELAPLKAHCDALTHELTQEKRPWKRFLYRLVYVIY